MKEDIKLLKAHRLAQLITQNSKESSETDLPELLYGTNKEFLYTSIF